MVCVGLMSGGGYGEKSLYQGKRNRYTDLYGNSQIYFKKEKEFNSAKNNKPSPEDQYGETLSKLNIIEEDPMKKSMDVLFDDAKDLMKTSKGRKYDKGKLLWDLFPFDVAEGVVDILTYGAKKYDPNNWQNVETYRYISALFRHLVAWLGGEELDKESGKHHLDHALCNLIFIRWQSKHDKLKWRDK